MVLCIYDLKMKCIASEKETKVMLVAQEEHIIGILDYLKKDIGNCIYMYIDIGKYGLCNPNMKVWFDKDYNGFSCVIMKYYDSIQIYSDRTEWDIDGILQILDHEKVLMISGKLDIIKEIFKHRERIYRISSGYVYKLYEYRTFGNEEDIIQSALPSDVQEIAELICSDEEIGGHYTVANLAEQLLERMKTGMGRNYIIRQDGRIVAHIATYAEFGGVAVTSGLIVHPDYRNFLYGTIMESYLVNKLISEGIEVFTFVIDKKRVKFLDALGNRKCGDYGKLTNVFSE